MASHYEESLQRDVDRIRGRIRDMSNLVVAALEASLKALEERDRLRAYTVILRDRRIDEFETEIDRLCLEFIVRHQPVARHLRFVYIAIKINQDLERIGDYAESIARQVLKLSTITARIPIDRFREIAGRSIPMLRESLRAFVDEDAPGARAAMAVEDEVDSLKSAINLELFQLRQQGAIPLEALTPLMTIARRFERVSDQARNICEEVVYLVTGESAKHLGGHVWRTVFLGEHNSCRSQMAEAIANSLGQPQFQFASAGLDPRPVDSGAVEFLKGKGIDISGATPHPISHIPQLEYANIIVAVSEPAKAAFPSPTRALCLDWSVPDPSVAQGSAEEKGRAYEATYQFLRQHISDLCQAVLGDSPP